MLKQFEDKMQKSLDSMTNDFMTIRAGRANPHVLDKVKVAVRNIRRDANDFVKKQNKTGELNEDQAKDEEDKVQKMTDKYIKQIDEAVEAKSKEIMTV